MGRKAEQKTNAMRMLDGAGIPYGMLTYHCDGVNFDGELVAEQIGLSCFECFKTLVTRGENGQIAVCCIPVDKKLDLKALAAAHGCKRLEMVHVNDILPLTGYVRGGCSPVGMKKRYPTYFDASVLELGKIAVSAGARGMQLYLEARELLEYTGAKTGPFAKEQD